MSRLRLLFLVTVLASVQGCVVVSVLRTGGLAVGTGAVVLFVASAIVTIWVLSTILKGQSGA